MKIPIWAFVIVALMIMILVYREAKKHDVFNQDNRDKVVSTLTDNPFTQFVSAKRG